MCSRWIKRVDPNTLSTAEKQLDGRKCALRDLSLLAAVVNNDNETDFFAYCRLE